MNVILPDVEEHAGLERQVTQRYYSPSREGICGSLNSIVCKVQPIQCVEDLENEVGVGNFKVQGAQTKKSAEDSG